MARDRMRHLVADHRGQLVVVLGDLEQPGVDADLAARQRERVRLVVLDQRELPLPFGMRADGGDPAADLLDPLVEVRIVRDLALGQNLLIRLEPHLARPGIPAARSAGAARSPAPAGSPPARLPPAPPPPATGQASPLRQARPSPLASSSWCQASRSGLAAPAARAWTPVTWAAETAAAARRSPGTRRRDSRIYAWLRPLGDRADLGEHLLLLTQLGRAQLQIGARRADEPAVVRPLLDLPARSGATRRPPTGRPPG